MNVEVWKDVVGFEGLYKVSSKGRVKSLDRKSKSKSNSFCLKKERILKGGKLKNGYINFILVNREHKNKNKLAHRLVAESFFNIDKCRVVDHIDGNKGNNLLSNLDVVTHRENSRRYYSKVGRNLPVGVVLHYGKYQARKSFGNDKYVLGTFDTIDEAISAYEKCNLDMALDIKARRIDKKTSKYRNVSNVNGKWRYDVKVNGKRFYGYSKTEDDAYEQVCRIRK